MFPQTPLSSIGAIELYVRATIDGEEKLYPLGKLKPDVRTEEIQANFGGGTYELQALNEHGQPLNGVSRDLNLPGEGLWKDAVKQSIASQNFDSQQIAQQAQQQPYGYQYPYGQQPYGQPYGQPPMYGQPGFGQPGFNGAPPFGAPFMPFMPGFGFNQPPATPIEVKTGSGETAHVDPSLSPAERQRRYDEINEARKKSGENAGMFNMFGMMMQMQQNQTAASQHQMNLLLSRMDNSSNKTSTVELDSLRNETARLNGVVSSLTNQNNFLTQQTNQAMVEMNNLRMNHMQAMQTKDSMHQTELQNLRNEMNTLRGQHRAAETEWDTKRREYDAEILKLKGEKGELDLKLKGEGKFNAASAVEIIGMAGGVARDMMEAHNKGKMAEQGGAPQGVHPGMQPMQGPPLGYGPPPGYVAPAGYPMQPGYVMTPQGPMPMQAVYGAPPQGQPPPGYTVAPPPYTMPAPSYAPPSGQPQYAPPGQVPFVPPAQPVIDPNTQPAYGAMPGHPMQGVPQPMPQPVLAPVPQPAPQPEAMQYPASPQGHVQYPAHAPGFFGMPVQQPAPGVHPGPQAGELSGPPIGQNSVVQGPAVLPFAQHLTTQQAHPEEPGEGGGVIMPPSEPGEGGGVVLTPEATTTAPPETPVAPPEQFEGAYRTQAPRVADTEAPQLEAQSVPDTTAAPSTENGLAITVPTP